MFFSHIRYWLVGGDPPKKKDHRKLHGKSGKYIRLPKSLEELDESYGQLIRELSKR